MLSQCRKPAGDSDIFLSSCYFYCIFGHSESEYRLTRPGEAHVVFKSGYLGIPPHNIPSHDGTRSRLFAYIVDILQPLSVSLAKSSVLFFLLARGPLRLPFRVTCHIINVLILLAMAIILFTTIFQCLPVRRAWEGPGVGARCIDRPLLRLARTCWTMATDVAVLVLALWACLERRMARSTRGGVAGALAVGAL